MLQTLQNVANVAGLSKCCKCCKAFNPFFIKGEEIEATPPPKGFSSITLEKKLETPNFAKSTSDNIHIGQCDQS